MPYSVRLPTTVSTMHAIVRRRYGPPDVLSYEEVARPVPGEHDVLVRVLAAGVSIGDHHIVTGKPYVIRPKVGGLIRPCDMWAKDTRRDRP